MGPCFVSTEGLVASGIRGNYYKLQWSRALESAEGTSADAAATNAIAGFNGAALWEARKARHHIPCIAGGIASAPREAAILRAERWRHQGRHVNVTIHLPKSSSGGWE